MFKLAIFLCFVNFACGYLTKFPDFLFLETFNREIEIDESKDHFDNVADKGDIWVMDLELNMFDSLKLRKATDNEKIEFERSVGPIINRSKGRRGTPIPVADSQKPVNVIQSPQGIDSRAAAAGIMVMVNKFILSALGVDRDSHMPESTDLHNTPSLALYFKGPHCAVILKYGRNVWKFILSSASTLPSWFYEDHSNCAPNGKDILVPEYVQSEFYTIFSQLLRLFFRVEM